MRRSRTREVRAEVGAVVGLLGPDSSKLDATLIVKERGRCPGGGSSGENPVGEVEVLSCYQVAVEPSHLADFGGPEDTGGFGSMITTEEAFLQAAARYEKTIAQYLLIDDYAAAGVIVQKGGSLCENGGGHSHVRVQERYERVRGRGQASVSLSDPLVT